MHLIGLEQGKMYEMESSINYGKHAPRCHIGNGCKNAYQFNCLFCQKSVCAAHESKKYPRYCIECEIDPAIYKSVTKR